VVAAIGSPDRPLPAPGFLALAGVLAGERREPRVWWVVAGRRTPLVQVTNDAGRHWQTMRAHGLPSQVCAVTRVSAADDHVAWVVARYGSRSETALFETNGAGRTWRRVRLFK
jgi:hypothetical protein